MGTTGIVSKNGGQSWTGSHTLLAEGPSLNPCYYDQVVINASHNHTATTTISNTGGSSAHNNMPPYLAVYMWKRVS